MPKKPISRKGGKNAQREGCGGVWHRKPLWVEDEWLKNHLQHETLMRKGGGLKAYKMRPYFCEFNLYPISVIIRYPWYKPRV